MTSPPETTQAIKRNLRDPVNILLIAITIWAMWTSEERSCETRVEPDSDRCMYAKEDFE